MFLNPDVKRRICGGRMKNKKKVLAVAAGILAALLFAGCAGDETGTSPNETDSAAAQSTQQEDETMTSNSKKPGQKPGGW